MLGVPKIYGKANLRRRRGGAGVASGVGTTQNMVSTPHAQPGCGPQYGGLAMPRRRAAGPPSEQPASWLLRPPVWLAATVAFLALLAGSGTWLTVRYRPDPSVPSVFDQGVAQRDGAWVGDAHRVLALLFCVAAAGLAVSLVVAALRRPAGLPVVGGLVALLAVTTGAAMLTGSLLPWSQLALWAVTLNTDFAGVWRAAFDPAVRFVLTDTHEVTQADYRVVVVTHLFAAPAAAIVAAVLLVRRGSSPRRRSSS